jgi:hypothetical protein
MPRGPQAAGRRDRIIVETKEQLMISRSQVAVGLVCLALASCSSCPDLDAPLQNVVVFQYDHVANVDLIRFDRDLVTTSGTQSGARAISGGFWAVFVICSLDVQGNAFKERPFDYDVANFVVEHNGRTYGALEAFTLNAGGTTWPAPGDTQKAANAVAGVVQIGPSTQKFPRGFYPSLNYRIAILVKDRPPNYSGEQLTLRYVNQPSIMQGRGQRPATLFEFGRSIGELPRFCREPVRDDR